MMQSDFKIGSQHYQLQLLRPVINILLWVLRESSNLRDRETENAGDFVLKTSEDTGEVRKHEVKDFTERHVYSGAYGM